MNLGIEGRTALIVGSSRSIGLEALRELRAQGCKVIGVSRTEGHDLMPLGAPEAFCATISDIPDIIIHAIGGSQGLTKTLLLRRAVISTQWVEAHDSMLAHIYIKCDPMVAADVSGKHKLAVPEPGALSQLLVHCSDDHVRRTCGN